MRGQDYRPALPFCQRCMSGRCRKCWSWVRVRKSESDPTFNLIGRPRGPQMPCGWGCGAKLGEHQMRAHFTKCPKRPLAISHVVRASRGKRGRSPGVRMLCGWRCRARLTASQMLTHFTNCPRRPEREACRFEESQRDERLRKALRMLEEIEAQNRATASPSNHKASLTLPVKSVSNEKRILLSIAGRYPPPITLGGMKASSARKTRSVLTTRHNPGLDRLASFSRLDPKRLGPRLSLLLDHSPPGRCRHEPVSACRHEPAHIGTLK